MTNHELSQSGELSSQEVFDIFDRASSPQRNTYFQYHIGDGIAVQAGWVDNDGAGEPHLTIHLEDSRHGRGLFLGVDERTAGYTRRTRPVFAGLGWLAASPEERHAARELSRSQSFLIPTAALEPIAQAVAHQDRYTGQISEEMFRDMLSAEPLPATDIEAIRSLIQEFSQPLD